MRLPEIPRLQKIGQKLAAPVVGLERRAKIALGLVSALVCFGVILLFFGQLYVRRTLIGAPRVLLPANGVEPPFESIWAASSATFLGLKRGTHDGLVIVRWSTNSEDEVLEPEVVKIPLAALGLSEKGCLAGPIGRVELLKCSPYAVSLSGDTLAWGGSGNLNIAAIDWSKPDGGILPDKIRSSSGREDLCYLQFARPFSWMGSPDILLAIDLNASVHSLNVSSETLDRVKIARFAPAIFPAEIAVLDDLLSIRSIKSNSYLTANVQAQGTHLVRKLNVEASTAPVPFTLKSIFVGSRTGLVYLLSGVTKAGALRLNPSQFEIADLRAIQKGDETQLVARNSRGQIFILDSDLDVAARFDSGEALSGFAASWRNLVFTSSKASFVLSLRREYRLSESGKFWLSLLFSLLGVIALGHQVSQDTRAPK